MAGIHLSMVTNAFLTLQKDHLLLQKSHKSLLQRFETLEKEWVSEKQEKDGEKKEKEKEEKMNESSQTCFKWDRYNPKLSLSEKQTRIEGNSCDNGHLITSSNGWDKGIHKWMVDCSKGMCSKQAVGIVSNWEVDISVSRLSRLSIWLAL